jgi:hypothetical protein
MFPLTLIWDHIHYALMESFLLLLFPNWKQRGIHKEQSGRRQRFSPQPPKKKYIQSIFRNIKRGEIK